MITELGVLDEILSAHARSLGDDFVPYRNHVYRVVNLCVRLHFASGDELRRLAIAAAFHDLGIWTAGTFDYLRPPDGTVTVGESIAPCWRKSRGSHRSSRGSSSAGLLHSSRR